MTYALGPKSRANLAGVHPDLARVVDRAIALTNQDFVVQEGLRTIEVQREYMRRGATRTLKSLHLVQPDGHGHAVDLVPWINGQPRWEWGAIWPIAAAMRQAGQELKIKLVWGGIWDRILTDLPIAPGITAPASLKRDVDAYCIRHPGPDFLDGPHYQLA